MRRVSVQQTGKQLKVSIMPEEGSCQEKILVTTPAGAVTEPSAGSNPTFWSIGTKWDNFIQCSKIGIEKKPVD
jgi:hypothetical protein